MPNGVYTVQDIIDRVRRSFGDESAVQIEQNDIIHWINDACREVVMQHENLLQTSGNIDSVAGQEFYTPPANCFTVNVVQFRQSNDPNASYYTLRYMSSAQLAQLADGWRGNDYGSGVPQIFTRADDGSFGIFPAPDVARTGAIKIIYARYAADVTGVNDPIDLPAYYHSYVDNFCMMKAYEMDEDWEAADRKAQLIQSTINFNNNRESWFGRETYPTITTKYEDY
jgi:hypothetical protein